MISRLALPTFLLALCAAIVIAEERCSELGIKATGGFQNREFKICSKDRNGHLTSKTILCGENSIFSTTKNKCVLNPILTSRSQGIAAQPSVFQGYSLASPSSSSPSFHSGTNCLVENGKFCYSCTTLVTCSNNKIVNVEHCSGCDPYANKCTNEHIPECSNNDSFYCTSFGLFPDPYFCNRFHFCLGVESPAYTFHCPPGMKYDGLEEKCLEDQNYYAYNYYVPCPGFEECVQPYQVGKMWANAQYYYSCTPDLLSNNLIRTVYKCEKNHRFNNHKCVPN